MKYKWEILWSDGRRENCVYYVDRKIAEWGVRKCIEDTITFSLEPIEPIQIWFIPEE